MTLAYELEAMECCNCGIFFAVPKAYLKDRRLDKKGFYCPNGHSLSYAEGSLEKLARQKQESEQALHAQLNKANHARLVAEKERDGERRKRQKVEKRVANGVCPCCNRTFADLARHMNGKHPEFVLLPAKPKEIEGTVAP